jgi:hypothetical protein
VTACLSAVVGRWGKDEERYSEANNPRREFPSDVRISLVSIAIGSGGTSAASAIPVVELDGSAGVALWEVAKDRWVKHVRRAE